MFRLSTLVALTSLLGCYSTTSDPTGSITGRLGPGFDSPPVEVRATLGARVVTAGVDAAGAFEIGLLRGGDWELDVVQADGTTVPFVFPRSSGLDHTIAVRGGTQFDLGTVRRVAPFDPAEIHPRSDDGDGDDDDVECEDGIDAATGLPCDDDDDDDDDECDDDDGERGDHDGDHENDDGDDDDDDDDDDDEDARMRSVTVEVALPDSSLRSVHALARNRRWSWVAPPETERRR